MTKLFFFLHRNCAVTQKRPEFTVHGGTNLSFFPSVGLVKFLFCFFCLLLFFLHKFMLLIGEIKLNI